MFVAISEVENTTARFHFDENNELDYIIVDIEIDEFLCDTRTFTNLTDLKENCTYSDYHIDNALKYKTVSLTEDGDSLIKEEPSTYV